MASPATTVPDQGPPVDPAGARPESKKISHTCVTCRVRKVRCDGRRDICANCERLGFSCTYDDRPSGSGAEGGDGGGGGGGAGSKGAAGSGMPVVPRRRARQACQNCHARKARCSGGMPQCDRCRALGIECVYRPGKRSKMSPIAGTGARASADETTRDDAALGRSRSESLDHDDPTSAVSTTASPDGTDREAMPSSSSSLSVAILEPLAMRTFDLFFRHLHHIPTFAFLHRASLMQRYRAGLVDRALLLALVGITSLMTELGADTKDLGRRCIEEAETLVLGQLERPSTPALQTLVFLIHHRILSGKFFLAFMLHGVASRLATALRLNHENGRLCFLARESRRRLMWSLFMIDTSMANGEDDLSLWAYRPDTIDIQLPCNERNFEFDLPEKSEPLYPPPMTPGGSVPPLPDDMGFLALHVRIRALRGCILQYAKRAAAAASLDHDVASIPGRCAALAADLDAFAARLPASFQWSEANVRLRTYSPRLCVFLMTHVWWQQCHCELYRIALQGLKEALPAACLARLEVECPSFVQHCRLQVLEHARAMAAMFRLLLTMDNGVPVTDLDLPICVYQCARLLLYIGRTSPNDPLKPVDDCAELAAVCVRVLDQSIKTPATARLRTSLDQLMRHGFSADIVGSITNPEITDMEVDVLSSELLQPALGGGMASPPSGVVNTMPSASTGMAKGAMARQMGQPHIPPGMSAMVVPPLQDPFVSQMSAVVAPFDPDRPSTTVNAPLDAFDLDMDNNLGSMDLSSWFSGDWEFPRP